MTDAHAALVKATYVAGVSLDEAYRQHGGMDPQQQFELLGSLRNLIFAARRYTTEVEVQDTENTAAQVRPLAPSDDIPDGADSTKKEKK